MAFDVSNADIETRWRALTDDESDVAAVRLLDADRKLRGLRPTLAATYAALVADVPPITVKADLLAAIAECEANAVIRFLRNPDSTIRQDIGADGSIGIGFDARYEGGVYIAEDDLYGIDLAVAAAAGTIRPKVGSQRLISTWPWRTTTP